MKRCAAAIVVMMCLAGCGQSTVEDPKAQGARQLEKMHKEGMKQALSKANILLKNKQNFILISSGPDLCVYEKEEKQSGLEYNGDIQQTFTGKFVPTVERYASELPAGTKMYSKVTESAHYVYSETGSRYRCTQYNGN